MENKYLLNCTRATVVVMPPNAKEKAKYAWQTLKKYNFNHKMSLRTTPLDNGYQLIGWNDDGGVPRKRLFEIREEAGDLKSRILADRRGGIGFQTLFSEMTKTVYTNNGEITKHGKSETIEKPEEFFSKIKPLEQKEYHLQISLVPTKLWGKSLYNLLSHKEWKEFRKQMFLEQGEKCKICGSTERTLMLHEIWDYNDEKKIATLVGTKVICNLCHGVHHYYKNKEKFGHDTLMEQFCKINKCNPKDFDIHLNEATTIWHERFGTWDVNFGNYEYLINKDKN